MALNISQQYGERKSSEHQQSYVVDEIMIMNCLETRLFAVPESGCKQTPFISICYYQ